MVRNQKDDRCTTGDDPEPYIPSDGREPHPKDVGRKPGRIEFTDGTDERFDHVDAHDGYIHAQGSNSRHSDRVFKFPWHRVEEVRLDL